EYDIQMYFSRAKAWPLVLADPAEERRHLATALDRCDWEWHTTELDGLRGQLRGLLDEHCTEEVLDRSYRSGTVHDWALHQELARDGWIAAQWGPEWGGAQRDPFDLLMISEELARAGVPNDGWNVSETVALTLSVTGSEEQKQSIIPRVLRGEIVIC